MSGGGSKKPDPIMPSLGEKIQAQTARDQIDYYRNTYQPLEQAMLYDANQDRSSRFAAEAGTAATREITPSLQQAAMMGTTADTAALGSAVGQARGAGLAMGVRDQADRRADAVGVGLGATSDATKSLSQAAAIQTDVAIDKARLEIAKQQAKNDERAGYLGGLASLAGTYVGYKMPSWKQALDARKAAKQSLKMGSTQRGYSDQYLSGWAGPKK